MDPSELAPVLLLELQQEGPAEVLVVAPSVPVLRRIAPIEVAQKRWKVVLSARPPYMESAEELKMVTLLKIAVA